MDEVPARLLRRVSRQRGGRHEYWRQKYEAHRGFADAQPNDGHRCLAAWQRAGHLRAVITQNIDGLHQLACSDDVVELHGTAREVACIDCDGRYDPEPLMAQFGAEDRVPPCPDCGGRLKNATISFGQSLSSEVLERAVELARTADLLLAVGSSLVVEPAASLPRLAKQSGSRLVIINRDATPLDPLADIVINAPIGATLTQIADALNDGRHNRP
ncbi:MAG: Sir2 family NAD-dependent protein deacetylase [Pirellulales bacterium]